MLNETQKFKIRSFVDVTYFTLFEERSPEIQLLALRSALYLSVYAENFSKITEYNIHQAVKDLGELLSHPAPQNPNAHDPRVIFSPKSSSDPVTVCIVKNGQLKEIHHGLLNLVPDDTPGEDSTAKDIHDFIFSLIEEKINKILSENPALHPQANPEIPTPKAPTSSDADFSQLSLGEQLDFLKIDEKEIVYDSNKSELYLKFLLQFGISLEEIQSAGVLFHLNKWHARCREERAQTLAYIGACNSFSFIDLVNAKLGRLSEIQKHKKISFYTFKALQRIALANGHTQVIEALGSDHCDIARLLIDARKHSELENILSIHGKDILFYHANFLLSCALQDKPIDLDILTIVLNHLAISPEFIFDKIEQYIEAEDFSNDGTEKLMTVLLSSVDLKGLLSLELSKKAFQFSIVQNSLNLQVLVLMFAHDDFVPKAYLSRDVFMSIVKAGFYQTAIKMAILFFPKLLSTQDLQAVTALSHGKLNFSQIGYSTKIQYELVQPMPSILPAFELATQRSLGEGSAEPLERPRPAV